VEEEQCVGGRIRPREEKIRMGRWRDVQQEVARTPGIAASCRAEKQRSARGGREREFPKDLF
jgi:hypothetical protein